MKNQTNKLEQKIKDSFIAYFDRQPVHIKIDGEYATVDGFYCKILGKATVERDWAMGKLKGLDMLNKKSLVESKPKIIAQARQCELLGLSRSSIYYKPRIMSSYNLSILNKIDEIYTDNPEYGYRYIHRQLLEEGFCVGRDRVLKYMGMMGIEAIAPRKKKSISIKDDSHKIHKYLLDGVKFPPDTVRRMKAFFDRHEVDKKGSTWDEQGKGWQA